MRVADFDFELPEDRIAQVPAEPRDAARLLFHDVAAAATEHAQVRDLARFLRRGDLLVVNDTRVIPARLCGRRATGGAVEVLVLGPVGSAGSTRPVSPASSIGSVAGARSDAVLWRAFVRPAARLRPGEELLLEEGALRARAVERPTSDDGRPGQEWHLAIEDARGAATSLPDLLQQHGRMPLPPYIHRPRGADERAALDRERYQTVFARRQGAIAAPTAGLHFTERLLAELADLGVARAAVTLHVGLGTFQPVTVEDTADHRMHAEEFELPEATARAVDETRARGGRVVAVGTTSVRVLESVARDRGRIEACSGSTAIFIEPGHVFRAVDVLLTNFHLPQSTLLMLVSAFAGRERVLELYREAVERRYRFFSYGDAMLLARRS